MNISSAFNNTCVVNCVIAPLYEQVENRHYNDDVSQVWMKTNSSVKKRVDDDFTIIS